MLFSMWYDDSDMKIQLPGSKKIYCFWKNSARIDFIQGYYLNFVIKYPIFDSWIKKKVPEKPKNKAERDFLNMKKSAQCQDDFEEIKIFLKEE